MKTVYISEKPSQALEIAKVVGLVGRKEGYLELKGGDAMTWEFGHLLELVEPKEYFDAWAGRWAWDQLPMIPPAFKYKVVPDKASQLKIIKALLKTADRVVIATDAGREGELIGREVLHYCKYKGPIERLWVSSLVATDIARALKVLRPGKETEPLYEAALARQHCDWVHGLSLTRAASLAADVRGAYFPVGRIQTPVLALVAHRDIEIASFKADSYFELEATVSTSGGKSFKMWHAPSKENRIVVREDAERLLAKAQKFSGPLCVEKKPGKDSPPMPYKLPSLQKDANRILGLTAKRTLEVAQILYDKKTLSYPRTDCEYLAESQKEQVAETLAIISRRFSAEVGILEAQGINLRDSTFNDKKLTDHHAIVPTTLFVPLAGIELQVYTLVALRYLQTISKDSLFDGTRVVLDANGVQFIANGKVVTYAGWKALKLKI